MECFGYTKSDVDALAELSEVTFQVNSGELRRLAAFFIKCADEMDEDTEWEHEHFSEYSLNDSGGPDVIVFSSVNRS